jgi:capsular polysaccharide transport system permease protein
LRRAHSGGHGLALRSADATSDDVELINKSLILWVGGISLTLGLIGERFLRGKFFS